MCLQIRHVEAQLQAFKGRVSHVQARLLSTLDALDSLQSTHATELEEALQTEERLKGRLNRYGDIAQVAELERDDLRDAVIQLVEKGGSWTFCFGEYAVRDTIYLTRAAVSSSVVEMANDYTSWPRSRIELTSYLGLLSRHTPGSLALLTMLSISGPFVADPIESKENQQASGVHSNADLLAYAASMIDSLRRERDLERNAYVYTQQVAESKIRNLKALLARREAELEACIEHTAECFKAPSAVLGRNPETPVTRKEIISILDATVTRNRTLEIEVKHLAKRVTSS